MTDLSLHFLGPTRVRLDGRFIDVKPRKALALLVYLAVMADRQSRDSLATMLWPDSTQRRARRSLRNRLSELNLSLNKEWLEISRESIALRPGFCLDVAAFQRYLADNTADATSLVAAAELYRNDFLAGFTIPNCPQFDQWQYLQTEKLRHALSTALEKLVGIMSEELDYGRALSYARQWLALDPGHEPAHRQLMIVFAQSGQQAAALRQYDYCRKMLETELGISPSPETDELFRRIQAREPLSGTKEG